MLPNKSYSDSAVYDGTQPIFSPLPYVIIIITFIAVITIGMMLAPSASGVGTHESLGLPPCGFLVITGYPCPSCGLTTAFVLLLHGHIAEAFLVQPFGVLLFVIFFLAACLSVTALFLRLPFSAILDSKYIDRLQMFLLVAMILAWIYKIYVMRWME